MQDCGCYNWHQLSNSSQLERDSERQCPTPRAFKLEQPVSFTMFASNLHSDANSELDFKCTTVTGTNNGKLSQCEIRSPSRSIYVLNETTFQSIGLSNNEEKSAAPTDYNLLNSPLVIRNINVRENEPPIQCPSPKVDYRPSEMPQESKKKGVESSGSRRLFFERRKKQKDYALTVRTPLHKPNLTLETPGSHLPSLHAASQIVNKID